MKKIISILTCLIICLSAINFIFANETNISTEELASSTYFKDGSLVTVNVIEYKSGKYQCTRILTAQYHDNDYLGFIHIGSTNQVLQISKNPHYGKVNDLRATYKYVAGNNYYIVNP